MEEIVCQSGYAFLWGVYRRLPDNKESEGNERTGDDDRPLKERARLVSNIKGGQTIGVLFDATLPMSNLRHHWFAWPARY